MDLNSSSNETTEPEVVTTTQADDQVLMLRLNRPARLNALSGRMVASLEAALTRAVDDGRRAIVLTGTGRAFCAGFDLKQERALDELSQLEAQQRLGAVLMESPIPVIAAINHLAVGAGCEIALACDFVIVTRDARISLPEVQIGAGMGGGSSYLLSRTVGRLRAAQIVLLGEQLTADEAHRIGLVTRIVEPDELLSTAQELAMTLASRPPHAVAAIKAALRRGLDQPFAEALNTELTDIRETLAHPASVEIIENFQRNSRYRGTGS